MTLDHAEQLKLSEAKYRALVEGSSDFIYVLDSAGYFTFANHEAENLLGYSADEVIGRHFTEFLHPDDVDGIGRAFHERRTGERAARRVELRLRSRGGDTRDVELDLRHFSLSASGIYQDKTFIGTHGVARDITERKFQETKGRALQILREAVWTMAPGDEIRHVLEAIPNALREMQIACTRFCVIVVNMDDPPALSVYCGEGSEGVHPQGDLVITPTDPFATEVMRIWRDGRMQYCRDLEDSPLIAAGAPLAAPVQPLDSLVQAPFSHGILFIPSAGPVRCGPRQLDFFKELSQVLSEGFRRLMDLQEMALSEKRYRTLVETPDLVVMLLDSQLSFLYVSPQIDTWLGYAPEDFYANAHLLEQLVHPDDAEALQTFLRSGSLPTLRDVEFRWQTRGGEYRWASGSLFPVYADPDDEQIQRISMIQLVVQDTTERKQVESRIQQSLEEKEVLLREIHHRVKNNLQMVSSLLNLQADALDADNPARSVFADSQHRINSMALVHEELYNSADLARIDFAEYIERLIHNLAETFAIGSSRIRMDIQVSSDPIKLDSAIPLGLIINELVSNSLKHGFPGERSGRIRVELRLDPDGALYLLVADDGVGMPADMQISTLRSLGLKIVQALAQQLQAELRVDSDETGTRFSVERG